MHGLEILQKKTVRIVTRSNFIAHIDRLFRELNVLKIRDMFKAKIKKILLALYRALYKINYIYFFQHWNLILDIKMVKIK